MIKIGDKVEVQSEVYNGVATVEKIWKGNMNPFYCKLASPTNYSHYCFSKEQLKVSS